jgi:hypothetical protein
MWWNMNMGDQGLDNGFTAVSNTQSTTMPAATQQRCNAQQRYATNQIVFPKAENKNFCFLPFLFSEKVSQK